MLKKDVVQRIFGNFFCFLKNNKEVSIPNHQ